MDNEQLIASLCDDIAMAYNGNPDKNDIYSTIYDYENLYGNIVDENVIKEVFSKFDVSMEETLYSVYEYNNTTNKYTFKDCYTLLQLEQFGISEDIRIERTTDSVQKYIIK